MRLRLILAFAFIVLVSVSGVVLIAGNNVANTVRTYMFRGGMIGDEGLASALEGYYQQWGSWQGVESFIESWNPGQGHGYGAQGMGMGHSQGGMMQARIRLADTQGNLLVDTGTGLTEGRLSQAEIANAIRLVIQKTTVGYLLLEGGMSFTASDQTRLVSMLNRAALTAGIIAGGISLGLVFFLAYGLMRPVRELTRAVDKIAGGDLTQRVPVRGNDELATLGIRFNQMASSLQRAEETRRAMTADIAHELRNPLAVQRANLEALQDGIYPLTPQNLGPILEQNQLLTRLVEDLRTLALADAGQLGLQKIEVDFEDLVKKVVERFRPQADSQGVELRFLEIEGQVLAAEVFIDPGRVEQILGNLLSNALRYTPHDGYIEVQTTYLPDAVQLTIHDSGPGIPQEAMENIFERFYRAGRSRARSEGGTGLGLAIARQLAQAHGGTLSAANHPEGGAVFTLRIPRNREANKDETQ
jgi:two-component system OmpR family sensor kinase/two-component system sensor histidine kinase BaeS